MAEEFQNNLVEDFVLGGRSVKFNGKEKLNIKNFRGTPKSYILSFKYLLFAKENKFTHIYCREEKLLFFLMLYNRLFFKLPVGFVYEAHHILPKKSFWYEYVLRNSDKIIALTSYLKKELAGMNVSEDAIFVSPDGVDLEKFDIKTKREEARERLNLPADKNLIVYTGLLYDWKGAQTLAEASNFLSENDLVIFVGGKKHHVENFKEKNRDLKNILTVGARPHDEIPLWLKAADVLVLPNTAKEDISKYYTSPMKLFEYMASGTPIVASDLPSIREVLNENNAVLVEPDNPEKLADGIKRVLQDCGFADTISKQAREDVQNHTWQKRAKEILRFMKYAFNY